MRAEERTATLLLSNHMLLDPLQSMEDEQFHKQLELALQDQIFTLLEEKAALEKQLEGEKEANEKRVEQNSFLSIC